jgi:hypothetical protein
MNERPLGIAILSVLHLLGGNQSRPCFLSLLK